jgi:hypothetical protein
MAWQRIKTGILQGVYAGSTGNDFSELCKTDFGQNYFKNTHKYSL